ncbi:MAG: hypothetical protein J5582_03960 [Ruminococcus sp.]|uniref:hypothetical protein n=1 Tax=Ruminococcus sp. TaxID=41978 RepID=UPI0025D81EA5|nr:hypothetical protein [Ruminococcus sp.]MBO4865711.1 hypothetical protein [Ruminococcus sp.]
MSAKAIKILVSVLSDEKLRKKIIILVLCIAFGFFYLLCLPVIIFSNLGTIDFQATAIDHSLFTDEEFMASLDSEQAEKLNNMMRSGEAIESAMAEHGVPEQTIKAELIYVSFFDGVQNFDADAYACLFEAADDSDLINSINSHYGLAINFEDYLHTYTFVMNNTINPYMFSETATKNSEDLAAWAYNAYESGWGYKAGFIGEKSVDDRLRYSDNAGLMIGYLNYDADSKNYGNSYGTLTYTEQGDISTMPDVPGIGLFDGTKHGIYIGNGEVIYCDEGIGYVTRQNISDGVWSSWCTYEGIRYPQIVQDTIDELSASAESSEDSSEIESDESEV